MFKRLLESLASAFKSFEGVFDLNPRPTLQRRRVKYKTHDEAIAADIERLRGDLRKVNRDYLNAHRKWRNP